MDRLLRLLAWLVACAVISAAQCSASCLAAPCDTPAPHPAHQCHSSPEKRSPKCPLRQYKLNKAEPPIDLAKAFVAVPAAFSPAQVAVASARAFIGAGLSYGLGAPPGRPLFRLFSELRI
jgi:hypothetical protein